ncbi:hypothetical protein Ciccas_004868 [Cichlidogyrus casuarinus]|uniref:Uncharacterized protein n=1 Tax=Cichlidogyrus casuarinus TaxID=1844966 RepID=A0ABD2QDT4_9PLAT
MFGFNLARNCSRQFHSGLINSLKFSKDKPVLNVRQFRSRPRQTDQPNSISTQSGQSTTIAAAGALGLGGLCIYGLLSGPKGSTVICSATAIQLSKNVAFLSRISTGITPVLAMTAVSIGCGFVCRRIAYPSDGSILNAKHATWVLYSASLGAMLAPICLMGGPILTHAALYTGGIVGGLSLVAACAPSDKFLNMAGPLAIGLGVVFVSSLGTMFVSPIGRLGMGLHGISLYGGLALFSGFLLYDTQKIIEQAQQIPPSHQYQIQTFDPINHSMHVLLDAINIFATFYAESRLEAQTSRKFRITQRVYLVSSTFHGVPDNQEVFANPASKQCIIVDILESVTESDPVAAIKTHFNEVADVAEADQRKVLETEILISNSEQVKELVGLKGFQLVKKFNNPSPDQVYVYMALYRFPQFKSDVLVYVNCPKKDENSEPNDVNSLNHTWSQDEIRQIITSLQLLNPEIFGTSENEMN